MKKIIYLFLAAVFSMNCFTSVQAAQFGTDFVYKDIKEMKEEGDWSISNEAGVTTTKNGVILDGSTISISKGIPKRVLDWKVGARCAWLGSGHSYLNVQLATPKAQLCFCSGRGFIKIYFIAG